MILLSADLGEGSPSEEEIWPHINSANVACGGHTGDEASMREAARLAQQHNVRFGAHPSYPDRENFGRKTMAIAPDTLRDSLIAQLTALNTIARIEHVKPHGALYNDAHRNRLLANIIIEAMQRISPKLAIVAPDDSQMSIAARAAGVNVIREAFADRRYQSDGTLTPRSIEGSTLTIEESAAQATLLATQSAVIARDGTRIGIPFDTICIHADMERALERLRAIRTALRVDK
ncbi:MAG: 5-oxoprolinase subunit PxpA [Acidobacteriota bacterium]|nr:5-oxoprolinase subunit PxpA [Acidobacteriota bacterium]